jgi:hypothetical protein
MSQSPESMQLHPKQRRTLIQLAFCEGRVEKVGDLKPDLEAKLRAELIGRQFVQQKKAGRGIALELTDGGWRWVMENLDSELPAKEQVAGVLMDVLRRLAGFLRANRVDVQDVIFQRRAIHEPVIDGNDKADALSPREALLRAAEDLGGANASQIRLRDLRPKLHNLSRQQVDNAIRELQIEGILSVIPIDLPTDIGERDREAAIDIAGTPRHAIIVRNR